MAVKLTLENNLDIKVSENILEISKNNSSILNSDYLPTISATSGITRNWTVPNAASSAGNLAQFEYYRCIHHPRLRGGCIAGGPSAGTGTESWAFSGALKHRDTSVD